MIYVRQSPRVCFLLPAIALGLDTENENEYPFLEVAWLFWAIGIGEKP